MNKMNMASAINLALKESLQSDTRVLLAGQDIGQIGGVFRVTTGLLEQFGPQRIIDTPISETMQGGIGVGLAVAGMRPIIEFQFMGFMHSALDQIIAHASRLRHRTRGALTCPVVYRTPFGGGVKAPEHHSESTEAMLSHIPGLRVIVPSSPELAYHLLKQAIVVNDPVVFLEPTKLYRHTSEINFEANIHLGEVQIVRAGTDLTMISWGAQLRDCLMIAEEYSNHYGIEIQVVDLSSLNPIDTPGLLDAVSQTNNALVVHEAIERCGLGAEIVTLIQENLHLPARVVRRLGAINSIPPYFQNEAHFPPSKTIITETINEILEQ